MDKPFSDPDEQQKISDLLVFLVERDYSWKMVVAAAAAMSHAKGASLFAAETWFKGVYEMPATLRFATMLKGLFR